MTGSVAIESALKPLVGNPQFVGASMVDKNGIVVLNDLETDLGRDDFFDLTVKFRGDPTVF